MSRSDNFENTCEIKQKLNTKFTRPQWRRETNVLGGGGGGARAVLFRQTEIFFRQTKKFSGRQHFKSPPPPSTTLTISDNIDNFPTGLNNRGAPPPSHGATARPHAITYTKSFSCSELLYYYWGGPQDPTRKVYTSKSYSTFPFLRK